MDSEVSEPSIKNRKKATMFIIFNERGLVYLNEQTMACVYGMPRGNDLDTIRLFKDEKFMGFVKALNDYRSLITDLIRQQTHSLYSTQ